MAEEPNSNSSPKKSNTGLLIVIVALVAVLGGAGGAWFLLHQGKTAEAAPAAPVEKTPEYMVHLETFTVNLADPEESHFLRITIDLGLGHAPKGAEGEKGNGDFPTARARDAIVSVLTVGSAAPLMTPEGKAQLKRDLVQALQQKVPEIDVRDVYFTEFLVQR